MSAQIRETGIDIIGNVSWGAHFCQFYKTKEDLLDILVPYFKAGLESNEFCMWVTSEPLNEHEARKALGEAVPDLESFLAKGQLEIVPHDQWYLKDGIFDLNRVLNGWVEKLDKALAAGYDGMRVTGNTAWLEKTQWRDFTEYEAAINDVIGKYQMMAVCTYWLDRCGASEVIDVVHNHEFALIKQEGKWDLIQSAFYRQSKKALKESEEKYEQLFLSMTEGVCLHEIIHDGQEHPIDYIITNVNPSYESITGLTREQAVGRKASELYGTGQAPYLDIYAKVASSGTPVSFETYFLPMKKHFSVSVFSPEKGKFATVFTDITSEKKAEEDLQHALAESEQRRTEVSALLEGTRAVLEYKDFDKAARAIFNSCKRLTGATAGYVALLNQADDVNEVLFLDSGGRPCFVDQKLPMPIRGLRARAYHTRRPVYQNKFSESEWNSFLPDKHVILDNVLFAPLVIGGKSMGLLGLANKPEGFTEYDARLAMAFGELAAIALDNSRNLELLEDREQKFRSIFEESPIGIELYDADGKLTEANRACLDIFGIADFSQVEGFRLFDDPNLLPTIKEKIRKGQSVNYEMAFDFEKVKEHGLYKTTRSGIIYLDVVITSLSLSGENGGQGYLVQFQDITERKEIEKEIKNLNRVLEQHSAELEASNKELEAFSYSVSHDLRAPLRSMAGFSQALLEDYADKLDEAGKDYLKRIRSSSQRMSELIDDLLELSRVARSEIRWEKVNLSELARSAVEGLKKAEPEREVEVDITPGLTCYGDKYLMQMVLDNLIGNAWKFTNKRSQTRIKFGTKDGSGEKIYFIRDNGVGFDMAYASKLFQPFQRLHTVQEFPGNGIGLATVQRIVNRLGGKTWGEGKIEEGATFYFTLGRQETKND